MNVTHPLPDAPASLSSSPCECDWYDKPQNLTPCSLGDVMSSRSLQMHVAINLVVAVFPTRQPAVQGLPFIAGGREVCVCYPHRATSCCEPRRGIPLQTPCPGKDGSVMRNVAPVDSGPRVKFRLGCFRLQAKTMHTSPVHVQLFPPQQDPSSRLCASVPMTMRHDDAL